jgi:PAS domain-containing protein
MVEISEKEYQEMKDARDIAESTINAVREPLIVLDGELKVISANQAFFIHFRVKPEETLKRFIYDLGEKQWDIPALRKLLEGLLPTNESFNDYEIEHDFPSIGKRTMLLNARRIPRPPAKPRVILLAIEDITERKLIAERILSDAKLAEQVKGLQAFEKMSVGRELKMIELEKEVNGLLQELGRGAKYK